MQKWDHADLHEHGRASPSWITAIGSKIPCSHFSRFYHSVWVLSLISWPIPTWSHRNFLLNTYTSMLCRLFDDHKFMYTYLSIHQEYYYLGKQKLVCISLHQLVNTCDIHLLKCTLSSKVADDWLVVTDLKNLGQFIKFLSLFYILWKTLLHRFGHAYL